MGVPTGQGLAAKKEDEAGAVPVRPPVLVPLPPIDVDQKHNLKDVLHWTSFQDVPLGGSEEAAEAMRPGMLAPPACRQPCQSKDKRCLSKALFIVAAIFFVLGTYKVRSL